VEPVMQKRMSITTKKDMLFFMLLSPG